MFLCRNKLQNSGIWFHTSKFSKFMSPAFRKSSKNVQIKNPEKKRKKEKEIWHFQTLSKASAKFPINQWQKLIWGLKPQTAKFQNDQLKTVGGTPTLHILYSQKMIKFTMWKSDKNYSEGNIQTTYTSLEYVQNTCRVSKGLVGNGRRSHS